MYMYLSLDKLLTLQVWEMLWISLQWQFKAVVVLSRETVSLPRTGQHSPNLLFFLHLIPVVTSNPSQFISPSTKNQIKEDGRTILSFWYYLHVSFKLLYTNLLIPYNIDFSRREIMLIRISEGFPHDPIFTFELCQSDKGNMSPLSCYCVFYHGLWVKGCPNLQPQKCVSIWKNNIFRIIFFPMDEKVTATIYWEFLKGTNLISFSQ